MSSSSTDPLSLLPAVRRTAWRLLARLPASVEHDDLVQSGMLGILERQARTQDDAPRYLLTVAWGAMLDYLRSLDPLTQDERQRLRKVQRARERAEHRRGGPVTLVEVAADCGLTVAEVAAACEIAFCGDAEAAEVADCLPDPADALAALQEVRAAFARYQQMPPRDRSIVDDWLADLPRSVTAARLGISENWVAQSRGRCLSVIAAT